MKKCIEVISLVLEMSMLLLLPFGVTDVSGFESRETKCAAAGFGNKNEEDVQEAAKNQVSENEIHGSQADGQGVAESQVSENEIHGSQADGQGAAESQVSENEIYDGQADENGAVENQVSGNVIGGDQRHDSNLCKDQPKGTYTERDAAKEKSKGKSSTEDYIEDYTEDYIEGAAADKLLDGMDLEAKQEPYASILLSVQDLLPTVSKEHQKLGAIDGKTKKTEEHAEEAATSDAENQPHLEEDPPKKSEHGGRPALIEYISQIDKTFQTEFSIPKAVAQYIKDKTATIYRIYVNQELFDEEEVICESGKYVVSVEAINEDGNVEVDTAEFIIPKVIEDARIPLQREAVLMERSDHVKDIWNTKHKIFMGGMCLLCGALTAGILILRALRRIDRKKCT